MVGLLPKMMDLAFSGHLAYSDVTWALYPLEHMSIIGSNPCTEQMMIHKRMRSKSLFSCNFESNWMRSQCSLRNFSSLPFGPSLRDLSFPIPTSRNFSRILSFIRGFPAGAFRGHVTARTVKGAAFRPGSLHLRTWSSLLLCSYQHCCFSDGLEGKS